MLYWVMYDISNDKNRRKVVKACKDKGLNRVQKSIFLGTLNKNQKDELKILIEMNMEDDKDSIYIFPSTREFLYDTDLIGKGFCREMVLDEIVSKII
ncbi:CRISPR-associated endonuclease Cas2 [Clostridium ihumii]|uniref:CRISPR-associated endonuclease Cas2 n=1 Tax=Clostridium ihumii TaxID=1470356 RepID=UPI003D3279AA